MRISLKTTILFVNFKFKTFQEQKMLVNGNFNKYP